MVSGYISFRSFCKVRFLFLSSRLATALIPLSLSSCFSALSLLVQGDGEGRGLEAGRGRGALWGGLGPWPVWAGRELQEVGSRRLRAPPPGRGLFPRALRALRRAAVKPPRTAVVSICSRPRSALPGSRAPFSWPPGSVLLLLPRGAAAGPGASPARAALYVLRAVEVGLWSEVVTGNPGRARPQPAGRARDALRCRGRRALTGRVLVTRRGGLH